MKASIIIVATVLVAVGIAIAVTGWNGMANVADNPTVVQEKPLSIGDQLRQAHGEYTPAKPANPLAIPVGEIVLGLILIGGGFYLVAGELKLIPTKTKITRNGH
jgi:hypothetical protein